MPSIQNFKEWTKERCKDAQRTYRDEQLDPIVDMLLPPLQTRTKQSKTDMTVRCLKVRPRNCFVRLPFLAML